MPEVERLLAFMEKHGLEEFEYAHGDFHVRLRKPFSQPHSFSRASSAPDIVVAGAAHAPAHAETGHGSGGAAGGARGAAAAEAARSEDVHTVKSPIVGTFYSAATPGSEPFVTVGSKVEAGQTLCIIEAMKLMNEIESDVAGEVARVFVENGQPVEYGEPLFGIRTHRKK